MKLPSIATRISDRVDALLMQSFINRGTKTPFVLATLGLPWTETQRIYREMRRR